MAKRAGTTRRARRNVRLEAALLELAEEGRGTLLGAATADRITMRVLGGRTPRPPEPLAPEEIRQLREKARMSQAVFARYLNLTTGYLSQLERGAKRPSGPALALLNMIKRKGIEAILQRCGARYCPGAGSIVIFAWAVSRSTGAGHLG